MTTLVEREELKKVILELIKEDNYDHENHDNHDNKTDEQKDQIVN